MLNLADINPTIIIVVIAILIVLCILASGYVKALPDIAYIMSGLKKKPKILIGRHWHTDIVE